jgi:hypothetical protein
MYRPPSISYISHYLSTSDRGSTHAREKQKDGSTYGILRSAVTVAHTSFYSYTPSGSTWTTGRETVDGTLRLQSSPHGSFQHPVTAQEVQGHGLKAYPQYAINGDGAGLHLQPVRGRGGRPAQGREDSPAGHGLTALRHAFSASATATHRPSPR